MLAFAEADAAVARRRVIERIEEGDETLTKEGPPPSLAEQVDREEKAERVARSFGDDLGSPAEQEARALRREVQRLRGQLGEW